MPSLKQMIKNKCEDDRSLATKLSKKIGFSNPTTLYKFLNDEQKETEFDKILGVVQELFPEREFDIMSEYIMTLNPNKRCAREALEYANINKLDDLFVQLLDNMENCSNAESKEWASVYRIDWEVTCGKYEPFEARIELNKLKLTHEDSMAFYQIAKFYAYYDDRFINEIENISLMANKVINILKDGFIKTSFQCRLYAMNVDVNFHKGNIIDAKRIAEKAINVINNKYTLTKLFVQLGNMYIYESYDKSIAYLKKSLELADKIGNVHRSREAKRSINFTSNYWSKNSDYLDFNSDEISDVHEVAFYNINNNNKEKGLEILDNIDKDVLTNNQLGFHLYYRGLATGEEKYFYQSLKYFNLAGEKFYKKLSLIELKKIGTDDYILDSLSV